MSLNTWSGSRSAPSSVRHAVPRVGPRLALSLYAGIAIYCILSALFGPAGLASYGRLEERKAAMQSNLADLEAIRGRLSAELESLKFDPDRIALEARGLGYLRKDETAVLLGERIERVDPVDTGKVLPFAEASSVGDSTIKQISAGVFLASLALLFAPRMPAGGRRRKGRD